jgi:AcrR family transcriptional regulator
MSNERDTTAASSGIPKGAGVRGYHHGDLRNGLLEAARTILEEESLAALTLRAVARKAGVSHAAPYRHFSNHEALLVELSFEGFE